MTPAILHLSPHPDDELIGAPATLMALRDAGWRVVNLACGLGRPDQLARREAELREACRLAGFELRLPPLSAAIPDGGDREPPRAALLAAVAAAIEETEPAIVVSPSPRDRHPAHELVAAVARAALEQPRGPAPRWWMWGLWGPLPRPTLATSFGKERLEEILTALTAHQGELERNDYRRLVRGRAEANSVLAPELLFGFGAAARQEPPYAELLTEVVPAEGGWRLGAARWLDPDAPLPAPTAVGASRLADAAVAGEGGIDLLAVGEVEAAAGEGEDGSREPGRGGAAGADEAAALPAEGVVAPDP